MKTRKLLTILSLTFLANLPLVSCGQAEEPSPDPTPEPEPTPTPEPDNPDEDTDIIYDSPSYDGGLEGNEANDAGEDLNNTDIETLFKKAVAFDRYQYEVSVNVTGAPTEKFTQYFTPNAWYTEAEGSSENFGYAQTKDEHKMFKYYINDEANEVYPSIYEYGGYETSEIITDLYSGLTITNISQLSPYLDEFNSEDYKYQGNNSFVILDSTIMSIFQFMTTYGSSIASFINSLSVQIVSLEDTIFETTLDLGSYGTIVGKFTPLETTKIDFVNDAVLNSGLKGVESYSNIEEGMRKLNGNNFTIRGIKLLEANGTTHEATATIYATNDYFVYDFVDPTYADFGFALIKPNVEVPVYGKDATTGELLDEPEMMSVAYDACYEFEVMSNGTYKFTNFIGPVENESIHYVYVDKLPQEGESGTLYITEDISNETDDLMVYEYIEVNGKMQWSLYSTWYDTVGDFYLYNYGATLYPGSTVFTALAPKLFEKVDPSKESETNYKSSNADIVSAVSTGLFGWGFQPTTTWLDYVEDATLSLNYTENALTSIDIGVYITADVGSGTGAQHISYNYSNFGTTKVEKFEEYLSTLSEAN